MIRPSSLRNYKWALAQSANGAMSALATESGDAVHPVLRQILFNRGLDDPADVQAFLDNRYLESRDPFLLADMDTAVERIKRALENDEQICVYGDFDADGVTSTVLLTEALRGLTSDRRQVRPYIPDRVDEGYGLNLEAIGKLKDLGVSLIISVDCGIRSPIEVAHAKTLGIDFIITDHHSLGHALPPATAIINPKRLDSNYPETMLAGVGIAYKLADALHKALPDQATFEPENLLDLVALGTVADLAPLTGENRKLVSEGLIVLNQVRRPGVAALMKASGTRPGGITASTIGFALGPRINAAGRLAHAYDAARLLSTNNPREAQELASELDALNRDRRALTARLGQRAESLVDLDAPILVVADSEFQSGVVGLVASRLADRYYRPSIVIEQGEFESRGSCRSITEFHITEALDKVADLLVRHGGHAQAAGFTLRNENLEAFTERMTMLAHEALDGRDLRPTLTADAEISLQDVDWALYDTLQRLEPTGQLNPQPRFMTRGVEVISHRAVGQDAAHLKLSVTPGDNGEYPQDQTRAIPAIAFRQGEWSATLPERIDMIYRIDANHWKGQTSLQLVAEDIRAHEAAPDVS